MQQRFFAKKLLESDIATDRAAFPEASPVPESLEFTAGGCSCSLKVAQGLQMLGYQQDDIAATLEAIAILKSAAEREINPIVFARIAKTYNVRISIVAALAALCRQEAADLGLVLRSLVRFYKRQHMKESDLEDIESFVDWMIARGEPIKGVQSAYKEYKKRRI